MAWGWAAVALLALGLWGLWRRWGSPLALLRGPEAVGYLPEPGWSRAQSARRARRGRRLGHPMPPRFPNGWFCLLESRSLRPGEARSLAALGEQFAVFRDWDGKAHVVDAYCPHLGANLAVGGRVVGSCIECPFHGWQFHGEDGRCTRIPYAEKVPSFAKVKVWPSCEVGGMIVVWYHCDGISPTWQVPEHKEILSHEWVFRGITEHYVSAHIEEIPENAADVAHLAFVHGPSILSGTDLRFSNSQLWAFFKHHWQAEWQPEPEPDPHCSRLLVKHHVTVCGKHFSLLDLVINVRQVGPALVFIVFEHPFLGRGVIIQSVTPVEPLLQQVVHRMYYQRNIPALVPKFILWAESVQFERDVMIWNNKKYLSKPLLVKEDGPIQRHRRWYAQFYGKDGVRATSPRASLDW
ncbi:cholesterol 7-desaturase nvd-like [Sceloporus undulatus]|uniref:cholesterol 7-desaturase nvd-like n=1 Tax=Sceloporus undulatus TaxID=8520 RepID=UPI001C4C44FF|nr:cholesterol 7-desaturase nvd-like [Sceloporus undulatus]